MKFGLRHFLSAVGSRLVYDPDVAAYKPTKGKALEQVFGATGTLNFLGYLTDIDEYNDDFKVNETAFAKYEQMRRGDPQVYALLSAIGLPVRSARWDVTAPELDPQPLEKEASDLVRENLFGGLEYTAPSKLTVCQSFDSVLSHALLMLPFGSAAVEEIWAIDQGKVRLARLSPRMPRTYWRWHVDTDGETLVVLEQIAYRGSEMEFWTTPADKLTIFSFQKEGSYFAGRSMLRAVYKPWFFKTNLEKIEAIAAERNGMGVPVGIHAPNASEEDRKLLNQWVTQIATHEALGLGLPNGAEFKLVGVAGHTYECDTAIKRYSQEITRAGLASFLDLGTTDTGARSVGDTLQEFFLDAEQTLADSIAWHMNTGFVRRLVDFNYPGKFGRGKLRYPQVKASDVQAISVVALIEYLDKLAQASLIQPDESLEQHLRTKMGFPPAQPKTARLVGQAKVQERVDSGAPGAAPAATPGGGKEPTTEKPGAQAAKVQQQTNQAASQMSAARGRGFDWHGTELAREPRGVERFVQFADVLDRLDGGKKRVAAELRKAKPAMVRALAKKMAGAPATEVHRVSLPHDDALAGKVADALADVYQFGRQTVRHEQALQRKGEPPPEHPQLVHASIELADTAKGGLDLAANTAVGQFQNALTSRMAAAALAAKRQGDSSADDLADDMDDQPDGYIDRASGEAANWVMSSGRQDEFNALRDKIDHFVYSALLDMHTCDECSDADGKEGAEGDIPAVPNPSCEGGGQCRCMWVAVFGDEGGKA